MKAQDYCTRKLDLLKGNTRKIQEIINVKKIQMQKVQGEMQKRMATMQSAMAAEQAK